MNDKSHKKFVAMAEKASKDFFCKAAIIADKNFKPSKGFYSYLLTSTDLFEMFLDNSGARGNRRWFFFTELIASIRNFVIAASHLQHIIERYQGYNIEIPAEESEKFLKEANYTLDFFNNTIRQMLNVVNEEGRKKGLNINVIKPIEFEHMQEDLTCASIHLPQNTSEEKVKVRDLSARIIELSRMFRKAYNIWRERRFENRYEKKKTLELIPAIINERWFRKLKNITHGVQSDYDTYVQNTRKEAENSNLVNFRGYASISLHLFYTGIWLTHFYERHQNQLRKSETKHKISRIVKKEDLLERMLNFIIVYTGIFLEQGNRLAENNLSFYTEKICYKLPVPKPQGFHARPATYVSLIVQEHGSDVFMIVDNEKYSARSVLSILEAGWIVNENGYSDVCFEGDKRVLDDLKILSEHNYCEKQDIPRELNYLRILRNK